MIYPTRRAILIAAAGAPVALLIAVIEPAHWYAGLAWPLAVLVALAIDGIFGPRPEHAAVRLALPRFAPVGASIGARIDVAIQTRARGVAQAAVSPHPLVAASDDGRANVLLENGLGIGEIELTTLRRGTARLEHLWLRWLGPLGLVWKQHRTTTDTDLRILPDTRPVRERGARLFQRHAILGLMAQTDRGEGSDYDSMVEYRPGMDRRTIDWKQSARHVKLHAREYHVERNSHVVLAIDAGRQMCEPIAGVPRVDRAVSAALLTAWIALKLADRASFFAFDARPRIASGAVSGTRSFALLQRLAATIDYSGEETNYTLGITSLAAGLNRRALIVLFTEFADITSADLMVRAAAQLVRQHLLLVVVLKEEELEAIAAAEPIVAGDITRAVTAAALLRERQLVLIRLRHMGVHVVESDHDRVAERLVEEYVSLKRRNLV